MTFAWTLLALARTIVTIHLNGIFDDPVFSRVVVALMVSFVVFWIITLLDKISDGSETSDSLCHAIREMIGALGMGSPAIMIFEHVDLARRCASISPSGASLICCGLPRS